MPEDGVKWLIQQGLLLMGSFNGLGSGKDPSGLSLGVKWFPLPRGFEVSVDLLTFEMFPFGWLIVSDLFYLFVQHRKEEEDDARS